METLGRPHAPSRGAGSDATPFEKGYVALDGQMTVMICGRKSVLGPMWSRIIAPGEV
ncbi:MAG: hypothetical protein ACOH2H_00295 [Cypionkella sp.]